MTKATDFIDAFLNTYSPDTFNADEFRTAFTNAFNEDQTAWQAAVDERDGTLQQVQADLTKAKADNWNLLTGKGVPLSKENIPMTTGTSDGDGGDGETETPTMDSFFGTPQQNQ